MKKSILIVSEIFYPSNRIGGVRPTKLAKYLHRLGYQITVFTSQKNINDSNFIPLPFDVVYSGKGIVSQSDNKKDKKTVKRQNTNHLVKELKMAKREVFSIKRNIDFLTSFKDYIDNGTIDLSNYDCIFTTFGPLGSLLCGFEAKKRRNDIKWINDFRDPMVSQITPMLFHVFYKKIQNRSIEKADFTTTVSYGYSKRIGYKAPEKEIIVIPNGYDVEDKTGISETKSEKELFSFAYTGALYEGKRDISVLFKQIKRLINERIIGKEEIVFHYAGGDYQFLRLQAMKYGLEDIIVDHGTVSRVESMRIMSESRFLVLSTWNDKGEEGVFPGKILEYMLLEKPIIALVGGNLPDSEVSKVIVDNKLGIIFEAAAPQKEDELFDWLKEQAIRFNNNQPVLFTPDLDSISEDYDWRNIVKRFCELINS